MILLFILSSILVSAVTMLIIIAYDRIVYRRYYDNTVEVVVLRMNNEYVRGVLRNSGIYVTEGANHADIYPYLCAYGDYLVCGLQEDELSHLVERSNVLDCDIDLKKFVMEIRRIS